MPRAKSALLAAVLGATFGCNADSGGSAPAAVRDETQGAAVPPPRPPFDAGPVKTAAEYLAEPQLVGADVARGELLGLACAACHRFRAEQGTLIGPHLQGLFGRTAGTVPGFDYSPALGQSGLVWTPKSLEAWLLDPAGFVAGTTMMFTGYRTAEDRRDLIAYLLRATQ